MLSNQKFSGILATSLLVAFLITACSSSSPDNSPEVDSTNDPTPPAGVGPLFEQDDLLPVATMSSPEVANRTTSIINAFDGFLSDYRIESGSLAVEYNGELVGSMGKQRTQIDNGGLHTSSIG